MSVINAEASPATVARIAGALYLVIIGCGLFAELAVRSTLFVQGDPTVTAANITASTGLFRLGFLADSIMVLSDVAVAVLLFVLFKTVSRTVALTAMAFRLTQAAVLAFNLLDYYAALLVLTDATLAEGLNPAQLPQVAYTLLVRHAYGYDFGLLLFGVHCLLLGWLIFRGRILPNPIGFLMTAAGLVYIAGTLVRFLAPRWSAFMAPGYAIPLASELTICLWLMIKGVREG